MLDIKYNNATLLPVKDQFVISPAGHAPHVAVLDNGNFAVSVMHDNTIKIGILDYQTGDLINEKTIAPIGSEQANWYKHDLNKHSVGLDTGGFAVAVNAKIEGSWVEYVHILNSQGDVATQPVKVSPADGSDHRGISLVSLSGGKFVAAWEKVSDSHILIKSFLKSGDSVHSTQYDYDIGEGGGHAMSKVGDDSFVVAYEGITGDIKVSYCDLQKSCLPSIVVTENGIQPDVASHSKGFMICWQQDDGSAGGIKCKSYEISLVGSSDVAINQLTQEFWVNDYVDGSQAEAAMAQVSSDEIFVVWHSDNQNQDGKAGIVSKFISLDGKMSEEIVVSEPNGMDMHYPTVTESNGRVLIAYPTTQLAAEGYVLATLKSLNMQESTESSGRIVNCDYEYTPGKVTGFNVIIGSDECDSLTAGVSSTVLRGGKGNDTLISGPAADLLDGGEGSADTVDYSKSPSGIRIDLEQCIGKGGYAEGDVLRSIERVIGSSYNDIFVVGNDTAHIICGKGNDTVIMSPYNTKVAIDCGEGYNTLSFDRSILGVDFNATSGDYHYGN